MNKITTSLCLALTAFSVPTLATGDYLLDPNLSSVSFATIKKQYIVEPASIRTLSGQLSEDGKFSVNIDLTGIRTGVPIRDSRLNEIYFESMKYPQVTVSGAVDSKLLSGAASSSIISAEVTLYGHSKMVDFPVVIMPADGKVMVSSSAPVIINAADFSIPAANLSALSDTVGGLSLSDSVPVSLTLLFQQ
ncbi:YceI family protein [Vibrio sp. ABG19]|uniref:YceI family protein n=1 Tax=Vibrio sp. ABG19 TaxID=2817385 RepID=UPI00249EF725|nr:YceI family protein [Vibrio sp. ABG19]WGY45971.1 YceI family protein [Vibrio sp. ABG19]